MAPLGHCTLRTPLHGRIQVEIETPPYRLYHYQVPEEGTKQYKPGSEEEVFLRGVSTAARRRLTKSEEKE